MLNFKPMEWVENWVKNWRNWGVKKSLRDGSGQCNLYELETVDLRCRKRVIEWVAVVETGMDKRGCDSGCYFVVQGITNTMEVTYVVVTGTRELEHLLAEVEREGSKTKPRLHADEQGRIGWAGGRESEGEWILDNCWGKPMSMNSVLDGLRVRRLLVIQKEIVETEDWSCLMTNGKSLETNEVKSWVSSA